MFPLHLWLNRISGTWSSKPAVTLRNFVSMTILRRQQRCLERVGRRPTSWERRWDKCRTSMNNTHTHTFLYRAHLSFGLHFVNKCNCVNIVNASMYHFVVAQMFCKIRCKVPFLAWSSAAKGQHKESRDFPFKERCLWSGFPGGFRALLAYLKSLDWNLHPQKFNTKYKSPWPKSRNFNHESTNDLVWVSFWMSHTGQLYRNGHISKHATKKTFPNKA